MSALKGRLDALRRASGAVTAAPPVAAATTAPVAESGLSRLRARIGESRVGAASATRHGGDTAALAAAVGGQVVDDGLVLVESRLEAGGRHGRARLRPEACREALDSLAPGATSSGGAVFVDTETTGLAGGTGTVAFLVGLARFEGDTLVVHQLLIGAFAGERRLLEEVAALTGAASAVVTYNGKSFDAPLLATRFRLAGLSDPLAGLTHVDLVHPVRRAWSRRWPDCRLQTAERALLGLERVGDMPGYEVPEAWLAWLRHGDATRLRRVVSHNRLDVLSLAALLAPVEACLRDPVRHGACALAGGTGAMPRDEDALYRYLLDRRADLDDRALHELGRLARRRRDWAVAVPLWQALAERGSAEALERLAKYHEHVAREPSVALGLAERLAAALPRDARHHARVARLLRRRARDADET
ncbi:MAG: ribonuclease H-like domain-containing protein [Ectothiorhodospiraceae bacterium]|nr:ribonuclease H-like domain-containing protein [Chromatiales bacterium]MCP5155430.1 ribonuclease H-like domain-containing protein [Ectothiorhodospiraceae bacterium]